MKKTATRTRLEPLKVHDATADQFFTVALCLLLAAAAGAAIRLDLEAVALITGLTMGSAACYRKLSVILSKLKGSQGG